MRLAVLPLLVLGLVVAATPLPAGDAKDDKEKLEKTLVEQEKKAWEGIKNSDPAAMKKLLAKDFMEVDTEGRRTLEECLKNYAKPSNIKNYEMKEIKLVVINKGSAILTYKGSLNSENPFFVCSVYANRGDGWKVAFWQLTPVEK